jgi:hypothetical protein
MVAICSTPSTIMLNTMGHLRPHLSPARPNMAAPTDRSSRVRVMAVETSVLEVP